MQIYEQLWREAVAAFERGEPLLDPHLPGKTNDWRRGVTLALRPSAAVLARAKAFSDRLAADFPGQYVYQLEELHVTVLAIISGSALWRQEFRQLATYRAIVREVLRRHHSFKLDFRGITASPGAVMIQGFPLDEGLANLRADLRHSFVRAGFGRALDRRYAISAAHITTMRFCQAQADWPRLAAWLQEFRTTDFGEMDVPTLQLIWGDWYASAKTMRILEAYPLPVAAPT
jgi:2'-5' RNA ligase